MEAVRAVLPREEDHRELRQDAQDLRARCSLRLAAKCKRGQVINMYDNNSVKARFYFYSLYYLFIRVTNYNKLLDTLLRPQVKFSVMYPGTHVLAHTDPTNCWLRAHLGAFLDPRGSLCLGPRGLLPARRYYIIKT